MSSNKTTSILSTRWPVINQGSIINDSKLDKPTKIQLSPSSSTSLNQQQRADRPSSLEGIELGPIGPNRQFVLEIFNSDRRDLSRCEFETVEIVVQPILKDSKRVRLRPSINVEKRHLVKFSLDPLGEKVLLIKLSANVKLVSRPSLSQVRWRLRRHNPQPTDLNNNINHSSNCSIQ